MKVYLKEGNLYWLDEPIDSPEAVWPLTEQQEQFLRDGGYADLVEGKLTIFPTIQEVKEQPATQFISKREFLKKFTPEEYATIKAATAQSPQVDYFWQLFMLAEEVSLSHPETIQGITMLEQAGILGEGRAAEILS